MRRKQRTTFQELSYGIPIPVIAIWCEVSEAIAAKYKAGVRSPSAAATKLFVLHLHGRVVPDEWKGFHFHSGKLWDPWDKEITHGQLRAYPIALQLLREFARGDAQKTLAVSEVIASIDDVPVLRLTKRR